MTNQPIRLSEQTTTRSSDNFNPDKIGERTSPLSENDPRLKEFQERLSKEKDSTPEAAAGNPSQGALLVTDILKQALQGGEKKAELTEKSAKPFDLAKFLEAGMAQAEGAKANKKDTSDFLNLVKTASESRNVADGNVILQTFQQSSTTQQASSVEVQKLSRVSVELVERILVSSSALNNNQEVKITFNQNLLAGTEVSISRQGNALNINFVSNVDTSLTFLTTNHGLLREHLGQRLTMNENDININVKNSSANDGAPNDGRSRNQREYIDADNE